MRASSVPTLLLTLLLSGEALGAQNITEIQVAPPQVTLKVGERSGLLATAFDRLGNVIPTAQFRWTSSNIHVVRVDNNGTVTGVAPGVVIVEAIAGSRKGVAAVQVTGAAPAPAVVPAAAPVPPPVAAPDPAAGQPPGTGPAAALRVEPTAIYLLPSENARLSVRALREDGGPAAPIAVTWTSLVPAIASVDPSGVVVALTPGQGTIKVTGPGVLTATAPVVVQQAEIAIREGGPLLLSPGEPDTLHVTVPSQNGRLVDPLVLSWSSSDTSVVRVGLTGILTPVGPGRAVVTVSGLLQSRTIDLTVHRPVDILVARPRSQDPVSLPIAASARFSVEALATDNTPVPDAPIRWSLSDSTLASFDTSTGALTGKAVGRLELVARAPGRGLAATWTVDVIAGDLLVTPRRIGLVPGRRAAFRVEFLDLAGRSLGPAPVTWSIEDTTVATIAADGTLSAIGWGRTRLVASGPGGKIVTVPVFVIGEIVVASSRGGRFDLYATQRDALADMRRLTTDTLGAADAAFSADGSRMAVVTARDGNPEIYVMDPDGTNATRLTNDPAVEGAPAFAPDGRTVVFHSDRAGKRNQVFSVGVDGDQLRQLTQDSTNSQPVVSPDGRTIAFVSTRARNYDIWLMSPDGTQQRAFTNTPQWNERHPQFLRDGSLAYLVERREGGRTLTQVMRADLAVGTATSLSSADLQITDFAVSPAGDLLALVVPAPGSERDRAPTYRVVIVQAGGGPGQPVELPARAAEQMVTPAFVP